MMNKNLLFGLVALLFACGESPIAPIPDETIPPTEAKEYFISLGMTGEITMTTSPLLSKAVSTDLYGIQVYSKPANSSEFYTPCAYGLFDDKTKMTIKLLEGYLYQFKATMVADGVNAISPYYKDESKTNAFPFSLGGGGGVTYMTNSFKWGGIGYFTYLAWGRTNLSGFSLGLNGFDRPFTDRYYGETTDFAPSENATVSIDMKRVVFGVKFIAEDLTEGKLLITMDKSPTLTLEIGSLEAERLVTFENFNYYFNSKAWIADGYSENVGVAVIWEKADGAIIPLVNKTLTFERKKLHTITIKVADNSVSNGLSLTQENGTLAAGSNTTLNSGDGIDTPVNPNP